MDALLIGFGAFAFWLVVGYAFTVLCLPRGPVVSNLLLAPSAGMALTEVAYFVGLRCGVPLNAVCLPIALTILVLAGAALAVVRPPLPVRRYAPFAVILAAAYLLNGWPQLRYGFDWVGFGSVDMSFYCSTVTGFGTSGMPVTSGHLAELEAGRDFTQAQRLYFIANHLRFGAELSFCTLAQATGQPPAAVCMSFALAMQMVLVSATGFLAHRFWRGRRVALAACLFMAVSAPSAFGILEQMLGQIGGLALLCACIALSCRPAYRLPPAALVGRSAMGGVLTAGLLLRYPEVIPFLGVIFVCVVGVGVLRGRFDWRRVGVAVAATGLAAVLLGEYIVGAYSFILGQIGESSGEGLGYYHRVYSTAHGVLLFWGARSRVSALLSIDENSFDVGGFWSQVAIAAGALAFVAVAVAAARRARLGRPVWVGLAVMAAVTGVLYKGGTWFGVHKMTMYTHPFLAVASAGLALTFTARVPRVLAGAFLLAAIVTNAAAQLEYTTDSTRAAGRCPFAAASATGLVTELERAVAPIPAERVFVAAEIPHLTRFLTVPLRGKETFVTTRRDLIGTCNVFELFDAAVARRMYQSAYQVGSDVGEGGEERVRNDPLCGDTPVWSVAPGPGDYLIACGPQLSALNYSRYAPETSANLIVRPLTVVRNHLVFRESRRSKLLLLPPPPPFDPDAVYACYGPLADPKFPSGTRLMYLNRNMTFQVLNPSPKVRLVFATSSARPEWEGQLASGTVTGAARADFAPVGHGSARLVTPPIEPALEGQVRTLRLDLSRENWRAGPARKVGVPIEQMVTLCRDLSAISEEEYAAFRPPQQIANFPGDLAHPHLEYSGVYEDGWVGTAFKVRLAQAGPDHEAVVRGVVPQVAGGADGFRTEMTVLVDGRPVGTRALATGTFEFTVPSGAGAGVHWLEVRFSDAQVLSAADTRRIAAHLTLVGFEAPAPPPEKLVAFPDGLKNSGLRPAGIYSDGWCAKEFAATLLPSGPGAEVVVRGQIPEIAGGAYRTELTLLLDGAEVARRPLGAGDFEVRAPAGKSAQARRLECRFSNTQPLPPPDGRTVGALLRFVGFEATKSGP